MPPEGGALRAMLKRPALGVTYFTSLCQIRGVGLRRVRANADGASVRAPTLGGVVGLVVAIVG